jgi:hypothetical protein
VDSNCHDTPCAAFVLCSLDGATSCQLMLRLKPGRLALPFKRLIEQGREHARLIEDTTRPAIQTELNAAHGNREEERAMIWRFRMVWWMGTNVHVGVRAESLGIEDKMLVLPSCVCDTEGERERERERERRERACASFAVDLKNRTVVISPVRRCCFLGSQAPRRVNRASDEASIRSVSGSSASPNG